jgi:hypothetical protein
MRMGRTTKTLRPDQCLALQKYRRENFLTIAALARKMEAPFSWRTLRSAMAGKPIAELSIDFIVGWLAKVEAGKV